MKLFHTLLNTYIYRISPLSLIHFVTEQCNARCSHCFIDFETSRSQEDVLKLGEIQELTKNFGLSLQNVYLTGGEPFLHPDLFEITKAYIQNAHAQSIFITSNGYFVERISKFVERYTLQHLPGRLFLTFSIDDFEEKHDANRRVKGLFQNAIAAYKTVEAFQRPDISPDIAITVTPTNAEHVVELYHHLKEVHGIHSITAIAMRAEGMVRTIARTMREKIWRGYEQLTNCIRNDLRRDFQSGYHQNLMGFLINAKNMIFYPILQRTYLDDQYIAPCRAGSLLGVIRANGDVYPCEILDHHLGNLRNYGMNFLALWQDTAAQDCRHFIRKTHCHCSFECAWSINIISNIRYLPKLCLSTIKSSLRRQEH